MNASISALMHEAERLTELQHWGDDLSFLGGLDRLLDAVEAMPEGAHFRAPVTAQALALLSTRLRLEDDARRFPEILDGKIERPLIVAGLPRTGTSWLFELLALDPACRAPLEWEAAMPWPAPEEATYATDPRISAMQAGFDTLLAGAPELATMHEFGAMLPAECNAIMQLHFASSNFWASYAVPEYLDWLGKCRQVGAFKTHKRVLQQLQWKGPRGRWTLKSPTYMLMIEDLIAAYPDACIVQTHREPAKTVASLANLVRTLRQSRYPFMKSVQDARQIAGEVLAYFGQTLERGTTSREIAATDTHFFDVAYRDLIVDPASVVERIYAHFDMPFTNEYRQRLAVHLALPRSTGHGAHKYDMAEFGLDDLQLPHRFPAYRARFGDLLPDRIE